MSTTLIHGKSYDLREFKQHPGGLVAIDMVRGMDATVFFDQFHVMSDRHRKVLGRYLVDDGEDWTLVPPRSAFHDDVTRMLRRYFRDRTHKASDAHLCLIASCFVGYAACWCAWWQGSLWSMLGLPLFAWLIMVNASHDGSHFAFSRRPWLNQAALLAASPLLYSFASWTMQHCVSHHAHTNDANLDVDLQHHPLARWHDRSRVRPMGGALNLVWHATAFISATFNMAIIHPWKFVVVPLARDYLGLGPSVFFDDDAKGNTSHEKAFFRVAATMHRSGFFELRSRRMLALAPWLVSLAFVLVPFVRFGVARGVLLTLPPYALTSVVFMIVTQISHVQEPCQNPSHLDEPDFFKRQVLTSLDYAVDSHVWRFLTGGLNVQSIHHVLPSVSSCHYTALYPEFYRICLKHNCAPARKPTIVAALLSHLAFVFRLGKKES